MNLTRKKTINLFAIVIVLLIAVPEIVGHSLFDKPHPENSSVVAAVSLANKMVENKNSPSCALTIQNDPSGAGVTRAVGLHGQFGNFTCSSSP
ncbi:exported hypothetical protein [Nitrosotalea sinensis]|uniref:Uncharacterized protein n=1 Tax=Nitrosotalea sinensis TaxID=1499975 RepID=A0A2H1EH77_9ARCH|nr:hypothetical protein [Candidatus Nitrosotalea sinensis]SHO45747.1 exported hypothetical protein [Candidatus Nitrosotalea sinensis]